MYRNVFFLTPFVEELQWFSRQEIYVWEVLPMNVRRVYFHRMFSLHYLACRAGENKLGITCFLISEHRFQILRYLDINKLSKIGFEFLRILSPLNIRISKPTCYASYRQCSKWYFSYCATSMKKEENVRMHSHERKWISYQINMFMWKIEAMIRLDTLILRHMYDEASEKLKHYW